MKKQDREKIYFKYGGLCAYSGTKLKDDWEADHINPLRRNLENIAPCQKIINHYKHSLSLEDFRHRVNNLHLQIAKLPKNPKTAKSQRRKDYMIEISRLFDITENKPFAGKFYFETINEH